MTTKPAQLKPTQLKAPSDMFVQGTKVNSKIIAAYATRVESIDTLLSVWANAATIQCAKYGNRNWLDTLFNMPTMRLKSGELSHTGKNVLDYITAHCPRIQWNKDNKTIGCLPYVEADMLANNFIAFGVTDASGDNAPEETKIIKMRGKFYLPIGDFSLTFAQFKNYKKESVVKAPSIPSMTAKAFLTQCDKTAAFMTEAKFVGTAEELTAAKNKVDQLLTMLTRLEAGLPAVEPKAEVKGDNDVTASVDTTTIDLQLPSKAAPAANKKEAK